LITCGKDKIIKLWRLPERWRAKDVDNFEVNEIQNLKDSIAMLNIQRSNRRDNGESISEDELDGWDLR